MKAQQNQSSQVAAYHVAHACRQGGLDVVPQSHNTFGPRWAIGGRGRGLEPYGVWWFASCESHGTGLSGRDCTYGTMAHGWSGNIRTSIDGQLLSKQDSPKQIRIITLLLHGSGERAWHKLMSVKTCEESATLYHCDLSYCQPGAHRSVNM